MITDPKPGGRVFVTERPMLTGVIQRVETPTFVYVDFDNIPELVGVSTARLSDR